MNFKKNKLLTDEQAQHFITNGYVTISGCLEKDFMQKYISEAYQQLGYDPLDKNTWKEELVYMDRNNYWPVKDVSPKGWAALCDIVGGEERIDTNSMKIESKHFTTINATQWSDAFVINFSLGSTLPWIAPSDAGGYHKDGSFFRHFLDSREQALLTTLYWTDVESQGGATLLVPDSIPHVAKYLLEHSDGIDLYGDQNQIHSYEHPKKVHKEFEEIFGKCTQFIEVTGKAGDLTIIHPFMLHASSQNLSGRARFLTNPPIVLKDHMNLNRENPEDYSLLERATLSALGVERVNFTPTSSRQSYWEVLNTNT